MRRWLRRRSFWQIKTGRSRWFSVRSSLVLQMSKSPSLRSAWWSFSTRSISSQKRIASTATCSTRWSTRKSTSTSNLTTCERSTTFTRILRKRRSAKSFYTIWRTSRALSAKNVIRVSINLRLAGKRTGILSNSSTSALETKRSTSSASERLRRPAPRTRSSWRGSREALNESSMNSRRHSQLRY